MCRSSTCARPPSVTRGTSRARATSRTGSFASSAAARWSAHGRSSPCARAGLVRRSLRRSSSARGSTSVPSPRAARLTSPTPSPSGAVGADVGWPTGISAITLFVEDLADAKKFYGEVFELPIFYEDGNSAVFEFGETLVNLLDVREAPGLVEPATVGGADSGARAQLTLQVPDVDAVCATLARRGVELLNGPLDRAWGIRTASFRDPGGHIWEIAQPLPPG